MNDLDAGPRLRYPGSPPFRDTDLDRRLFFGRDGDAERVLHSILSYDLFVLYARSGVGKTSLLQTMVTSGLKARDLWPVFVRLDDTRATPTELVRAALRDLAATPGLEVTGLADDAAVDLYDTVAKLRIWRGDVLQMPVLVLDQFEELFTLWEADDELIRHRDTFLTELGDIARRTRSRSPDAVARPGERDGLRPRAKIVLSLREEFLAELDLLASRLPSVLRHRQRLEPLSIEQARDAICLPAGFRDPDPDPDVELATRPFGYDDTAIKLIVGELTRRAGGSAARGQRARNRRPGTVESTQLQIICSFVETEIVLPRQASSGEPVIVTAADIDAAGGPTKILTDYYARELDRLDGPRVRRRVRRLCETGFISDGRRTSLDETQIDKGFGVGESLLRDLVTRRLLRAEDRADRTYYELAHDSLVEPLTAYRREQARRITRRALTAAAVTLVGVGAATIAVSFAQGESTDSAAVAQLAQQIADEEIAEAQREADEEIDEAQQIAEEQIAEAREDAAAVVTDAQLEEAVAIGGSAIGTLDAAGSVNRFRVEGTEGAGIVVTVRSATGSGPTALDAVLEILAPDLSSVVQVDRVGRGEPESATLVLPADGAFDIVVKGADGTHGEFGLDVAGIDPLTHGSPSTGTISAVGDVGRFPFAAAAGSAVTVTLTTHHPRFDGVLEVVDAGGTRLDRLDAAGAGGGESTTVVVPADGTYVAVVRSSNETTGTYDVATSTSTVTDLVVGPEPVTGEFAPVGAHRFEATADADITITVVPLGDVDPSFDLLDPSGNRLTRIDEFGDGAGETSTVQLVEPGAYVVVARSDAGTGRYALWVADHRPRLAPGQPIRATIDRPGAIAVAEFDGAIADVVLVTVRPDEGDPFDGRLSIVGPDGVELAAVDDAGEAATESILTVLPTSGRYVAVVRGFTDSTGAFELTMARPDVGRIGLGETADGSLTPDQPLAAYRLDIAAAATIIGVTLRPASDQVAAFELIDPAPNHAVIAGATGDEPGAAVGGLFLLPKEGEYLIAATGQPGDFELDVTEVPSAELPTGTTVAGTIGDPGQLDVYTLFGNAGSQLSLELAPAGELDVILDLLSLDTGMPVGAGEPNDAAGPGQIETLTVELATDGSYLVYVRGADGTTGGYTLTRTG